MTSPEALIDSNVVIAAIVERHPHHAASAALIERAGPKTLAFASHSYAETYVQLTRRGPRAPFQLSSLEARNAIEAATGSTVLVGLLPAQTVRACRAYAETGAIGARLYDYLIGEAAVEAGIGRIVTWNLGHLRGLFPQLNVIDPAQALA